MDLHHQIRVRVFAHHRFRFGKSLGGLSRWLPLLRVSGPRSALFPDPVRGSAQTLPAWFEERKPWFEQAGRRGKAQSRPEPGARMCAGSGEKNTRTNDPGEPVSESRFRPDKTATEGVPWKRQNLIEDIAGKIISQKLSGGRGARSGGWTPCFATRFYGRRCATRLRSELSACVQSPDGSVFRSY